MINVLLICGGDSSEHDISLISANYFLEKLALIPGMTPYYVRIEKDGRRLDKEGRLCELRKSGILVYEGSEAPIHLHYAIPCFHGYPGETGDIQSLFDMMELPYLGCGPEASKRCFNKIDTKVWLDVLKIPNTPYTFLSSLDEEERQKANAFFQEYQDVFVKASHQGSSIGCYHVQSQEELDKAITEAFRLSPSVVIEKTMQARELELAIFEHEGNIITAGPGEIKVDGFYDFDEKYSETSKTQTSFAAENLTDQIKEDIERYARIMFKHFHLKDMARIDFFLDNNSKLYVNEINTFPGHTSISLFPSLMEKSGLPYEKFLEQKIKQQSRSS